MAQIVMLLSIILAFTTTLLTQLEVQYHGILMNQSDLILVHLKITQQDFMETILVLSQLAF